MNNITAHPTTYKGINFRSRLEARWAAFFDLAGWRGRWEYEPVELPGYIPDFLVRGKLLVEIKPAFTEADMLPAKNKIDASGWLSRPGNAALVLGNTPLLGDDWNEYTSFYNPTIGAYCCNIKHYTSVRWGMAYLQQCVTCSGLSVVGWSSGVCGFCEQRVDTDRNHWKEQWITAGNVTQWRGR